MPDRPKKKKPSDYPQFAFRMNGEIDKLKFVRRLEAALKEINKKLREDEKPYTKSELILKAIEIGLVRLTK